MQNEIEQLEAVVLDAYRHHQAQHRRHQTFLGLIPGEPVDGEQLEREQVDEPLAA